MTAMRNDGDEVEVQSVVVSLVSHGHVIQVQSLLQQLAGLQFPERPRVVLTLNIPEEAPIPPEGGWPFELQVVCNPFPQGFGKNHNKALMGAVEDFLCILNPDVEILDGGNPFAQLLAIASRPRVGCAYPGQVDAQGKLQDSERALPTPAALWRRWFLREADVRVDWVNAACMVVPLPVWESVGGFDESYHMYCEDVDLCLRIQLAGFCLQKADCTVMHAGSRASHRKLNHLCWHISSLLRLWWSPAYRRYKKMRSSLR